VSLLSINWIQDEGASTSRTKIFPERPYTWAIGDYFTSKQVPWYLVSKQAQVPIFETVQNQNFKKEESGRSHVTFIFHTLASFAPDTPPELDDGNEQKEPTIRTLDMPIPLSWMMSVLNALSVMICMASSRSAASAQNKKKYI
jgi:hypothetical protein